MYLWDILHLPAVLIHCSIRMKHHPVFLAAGDGMSPLEPGVSADGKEDRSFVTPPAAATPVMTAKARHPKQLCIKTLKHKVDNTVTYLESCFSYGKNTMFYSGRWLFLFA